MREKCDIVWELLVRYYNKFITHSEFLAHLVHYSPDSLTWYYLCLLLDPSVDSFLFESQVPVRSC